MSPRNGSGTTVRLLLSASLAAASLLSAPAGDAGIELFESKIRPVLVTRCYPCHSAKSAKVQGGLLLDSQEGLRHGGNSGPAIDAANPDKSTLLRAIRYKDASLQMPPGKALPADVTGNFEEWVRLGAPMPSSAPAVISSDKRREFWSFQKPKRSELPAVRQTAWVKNDIDRFILAKLEEKGIAPSAAADKRTLIRRVTYDLTGLPATESEVRAFVADTSPGAYDRLIDRLLASQRYGERWGRYWLDVARYSDARNVGERFPYSYTYRDWVIRAMNEDLPYDQFLTQQLAADRLDKNDPRNLAALGFLSLGREFPKSFPETVDDRIDAVARGMLGLTVACARCHDHKYDPIPTKDYYSFYSIFSNIREPETLPALASLGSPSPKDARYEERLQRIRRADAEYRAKRSAEMIAFFKTQVPEYLTATHDSAAMSNTEIEELVRDRQLNLHVLSRWRKFLAASLSSGEPVFQPWHAAAAIPASEFPAKWPKVLESLSGANPLIVAELRKAPAASLRDVAARYAAVLTRYDTPSSYSQAAEEQLRLAMRGPNAAVNVPLSEFELIYSEGDGNNLHSIRERYNSMRAMYAYDGGPARAMAVEDVPNPVTAHVFLRGNQNNPGVETPPHFLTCLSEGEPRVFREGSGRLELARAIASKDNPLTARVAVNRIWLNHFGSGLVTTPSDFGLRGEAPSHPELLDYLAVQFVESGWSMKKLHRLILLSAAYQQSSADNPEARRQDPENRLVWRMNRRRLDIESLRDSMLAVAGRLDVKPGGVPYSLTVLPSIPRRTVYGYIERGRIPAMLSAFDFAIPDQHVPLRYTTTVPQQALFLLNSPFVAEQARALARKPEVATLSDPEKKIAALYRAVLARTPSDRELAAGLQFIQSGSKDLSGDGQNGESPWQYGLGAYDGTAERVKAFTPFRYFTGDAWQGASMLPDPAAGKARLRANGGEPGETAEQSVIRRWTSPVEGKVSIEGSIRHSQGAVPAGDGVRARIVSSRLGELAAWTVNGTSAETKLGGVAVNKGDTLDFIVEGRADSENDSFSWAPVLKTSGSEAKSWNATADFRGPAPEPLGAWERYAQVLLQTNEFAFVD